MFPKFTIAFTIVISYLFFNLVQAFGLFISVFAIITFNVIPAIFLVLSISELREIKSRSNRVL